ncbi:hypothetical protein, partial [Mammaliicoccus sciuri]
MTKKTKRNFIELIKEVD